MSETQERKGFFARATADKGSRKMLLFAGVVIVGAVAYAALGGSGGGRTETSQVRGAPNVTGTPDAIPNAAYGEAVRAADEQRVQAARNTNGGGATPSLRSNDAVDQLPTTLSGATEAAPVQRPVARPTPTPPPVVQPPPPVPQPQPQQVQRQQPTTPPPPPFDPQLAAAMVQRMEAMRGAQFAPAQTQYFAQNQAQQNPGQQQGGQSYQGMGSQGANALGMQGAAGFGQGQGGQGAQAAQAAYQQVSANGRQGRFQVPAAGSILYSRLIGRVNSDTPGPVVAEILQGPFARARLLGSFQFSEQGVVISFTSMTVPYTDGDGQERTEVVQIKAVAVDPSHLGTAMATDIDRHLFEKVGIAFGTAFLQGLGQAVAQSGASAVVGNFGTTVTNPTLDTQKQLLVAGGAAAGAAGQAFQQIYGNRRTTVTVDADTPFGLLFLGNGN